MPLKFGEFNMIKHIITAASLSLIASVAFAAPNLCTGSTSAGSGSAWTVPTPAKFVVTTFTPKCSASVFVEGAEDTTRFWGSSGSAKGKTTFIGNTAGGAVTSSTACDATGCTAANVTGSLTNAANLGS